MTSLILPDATDAPSATVVAFDATGKSKEPKTLTAYVERDFFVQPPEDWERRLREISPVRPDLAHLRFRFRDPHPSWPDNDARRDGVWMLYTCTPKHLASVDRAWQFERHWSELPVSQQPGRKAMVSEYQHWMWHTQGLDPRPFLILQGPGGTVCRFSDRERRALDGMGFVSEPVPIGCAPPCQFDGRTIKIIEARDRLFQVGNRLDALAKLDLPDYQKAEAEEAERTFRETYTDTLREMVAPDVDFLSWFLRKSEADMALPKGDPEVANLANQWRDQFRETGKMPGGNQSKSRRAHVTVK